MTYAKKRHDILSSEVNALHDLDKQTVIAMDNVFKEQQSVLTRVSTISHSHHIHSHHTVGVHSWNVCE